MRQVGEWRSPPVADLIRDINRFSNNVMADHVWLTAGAQAGSWPATREQAVRATLSWLDRVGADDPETQIDSGSGLSRRTRVTASQLHAVLRHMAGSRLFPEFAASLPIAGEDGTGARLQVQAHARLKTGSLNGVRAAAGYVRDRNGRWLSLVVMLEDAPDQGWRELLAWLVDRAAITDGPVP
jgi:D-alanyl-D-alanine carboxypeptidase/D-alanyl-D-alanine-endopeptidase (penicillin-binding protein 4)